MLMRNARLRFGVDLAKAILQEYLQRNILLTNEPVLRQLAGCQQIEHGADSSCGRDLNGAQRPTINVAAVDLVGVRFLDQLTGLATADSDEDNNHVLQGRRHCVLQNILQHVPAIPQAQVVEQRAHYHRMARIADRAVIERTDRPLEGITKSSEPARSV